MSGEDDESIAADWDGKAVGWDKQVGEEGDTNRRLNSDPVLWRMLGEIGNRRVLDAGCGTGYLSRKLAREGARVTGVDISPGMVAIATRKARAQKLNIEHRVDSASRLESVPDGSMDVVVSNYVLMDFPDLDDAARAMARVLVPGGYAVAVFSHPCFPQSADTNVDAELRTVTYAWNWSYFSTEKRFEPPWRQFTGPFVWWHRPLSAYTRAFRSARLMIDEIDEPHLTPDRQHLATD